MSAGRWTEHPLVQLTLVRFREFYPGAGGGVLGLHLSDSPRRRARDRVSEPAARADSVVVVGGSAEADRRWWSRCGAIPSSDGPGGR